MQKARVCRLLTYVYNFAALRRDGCVSRQARRISDVGADSTERSVAARIAQRFCESSGDRAPGYRLQLARRRRHRLALLHDVNTHSFQRFRALVLRIMHCSSGNHDVAACRPSGSNLDAHGNCLAPRNGYIATLHDSALNAVLRDKRAKGKPRKTSVQRTIFILCEPRTFVPEPGAGTIHSMPPLNRTLQFHSLTELASNVSISPA